jgi:23S rRNA (adenine2030-N6)-methyltransferase
VNYAHAFHAGSFADVLKHAVLARVLHYLRGKQAPFRVIDTHAGTGLYDLTGAQAARGGEWHDGIEKLMAGSLAASLSAPAAALLKPYLDVIGALNAPSRLTVYPGSPAIARACLRPQDRLIACEREPKAATALARNLRGDARIKIQHGDGWTALNAMLPPKERRGLVLVDPSFEEDGEFARLAHGLAAAYRKWPTGLFMLWYPIKDRGGPDALAKALRRLGPAKILRAELNVAPLSDLTRLNACGLILINPPWTLQGELATLLPVLAKILGRGPRSGFRLDRLQAPAPAPR